MSSPIVQLSKDIAFRMRRMHDRNVTPIQIQVLEKQILRDLIRLDTFIKLAQRRYDD